MKYSDYQDNPTSLRALTGLSLVQINELLSFFQDAHGEYLSQFQMNEKKHKQLRRFVIYANSPLPSIEERLFFILVYLKKTSKCVVTQGINTYIISIKTVNCRRKRAKKSLCQKKIKNGINKYHPSE